MACDSSIFRPIDSFIKYFGDIKPYHTKILEVVEQYVFREEINVAIEETYNLEVTLENDPLCKGVGFGLNFDDDCGFDALECCDLFECMGGFGLIFDNSDLLVTLPVTNIDGPTGQVTIAGNHLYDTYLNIVSIPDLQTIVVAGDQSAYFSSHELFWVVRKNSYAMTAASGNTITVQGNRVAQLLAKINIEIQNAGANDGHYGVVSATLSGGNTLVTLNRTLPANTLGNILVQSNNKNNGVYQIDGYTVVSGTTRLQLTPDTPARFTDAEESIHGAIQLRTGFVPNRKLWIEDDAVTANNGEWKIVQAWYDVPSSSTVVVFDGTLQTSVGGTTTINLYGYETGAGYDGLNECSAPQPYNISAQFSEWLQITIEDGPSVTPSSTPMVTVTPTVTPTITPSVTSGATMTPTITPSVTPTITPTVTPTITPSATPIPQDPFWENTLALIPFIDENGLSRFVDLTGRGWFAGNLTTVISNEESVFGGVSSGNFTASEDNFIYTRDSDDLDFGTGDFTIEAFINFKTPQTDYAIASQWGSVGTQAAWALFSVSGTLYMRFYDTTNTIRDTTVSFTPTAGQWYHIAATRASGVVSLYINGIQVASNSLPQSIRLSDRQPRIGNIEGFSGFSLNAYVNYVRISNIARYTSNFTVPTEPYLFGPPNTPIINGLSGVTE